MKDLKTTKALVHSILEHDKRSRNRDYFLYFLVIETIAEKNLIDLKKIPVTDFLLNMEHSSVFPPFESVRRSRQKVQAEFPHLAACKTVAKFRAENEKEFRAFALAKGEEM